MKHIKNQNHYVTLVIYIYIISHANQGISKLYWHIFFHLRSWMRMVQKLFNLIVRKYSTTKFGKIILSTIVTIK